MMVMSIAVGQNHNITRKSTPSKKVNNVNSTKNKDVISSPSGYLNGHGYVDLGLSVKWATVNLGARNYYEKGNYYLFGAINDNGQKASEIKSDIVGNERYDAARFNWHGSWRLPTKQEIEELWYNCVWKKRTIKGVPGYVVTGRNGNCIFLPLTSSYMYGKKLDVTGYWTGSCELQSGFFQSAYPFALTIDIDSSIEIGISNLSVKFPIRAVAE